jgi:hypothetical protein
MKTFSIRASIKRGWALFKSHKHTLIISLIVLTLLQSVMGDNKGGLLYSRESGLRILIIIIAWVAVTVVRIGWLKITLLIEDGQSPKWTDVFAYGDYFLKFFLASFLYAFGTGVFLLLLVVPGIYFAITYSFVPLLVIDTDLSIGESFKRSAEMTKGHKWKLFGLLLVSILLVMLGLLALVVGVFVAIPVTALAYAHAYRVLSRSSGHPSNPEAPEMAL